MQRTYRLIDLLPNGVGVLDAVDGQMQSKRRFLHASDLPVGAILDSRLAFDEDGVAILVDQCYSLDPAATLLGATVKTIADELKIPLAVAAQLCMSWLSNEFRFLCE